MECRSLITIWISNEFSYFIMVANSSSPQFFYMEVPFPVAKKKKASGESGVLSYASYKDSGCD